MRSQEFSIGSVALTGGLQEELDKKLPAECMLRGNMKMRYGSEPDISFRRDDELLAVIEIQGGIDPA